MTLKPRRPGELNRWQKTVLAAPLPPNTKLVALAMAHYADTRGIAHPTLDQLAADCSVTVTTVREATKRLEGWRFIDRNREGRTTTYRLRPPN